MKTAAQKRQERKEQANKEAKQQAKLCFYSITLIVGVIAYNIVKHGVTQNLITFNF